MSRSLWSPLDKARAYPPPPQALVPRPGGTLRSDRQVAAPARIGVGLWRPALAKRSLTFSRWRSLLLPGRGRRQIPRQRRRRGRAAGPGALINKPCGSLRPLCWGCGTRAPRGGGTCPHSTLCQGDRSPSLQSCARALLLSVNPLAASPPICCRHIGLKARDEGDRQAPKTIPRPKPALGCLAEPYCPKHLPQLSPEISQLRKSAGGRARI